MALPADPGGVSSRTIQTRAEQRGSSRPAKFEEEPRLLPSIQVKRSGGGGGGFLPGVLPPGTSA